MKSDKLTRLEFNLMLLSVLGFFGGWLWYFRGHTSWLMGLTLVGIGLLIFLAVLQFRRKHPKLFASLLLLLVMHGMGLLFIQSLEQREDVLRVTDKTNFGSIYIVTASTPDGEYHYFCEESVYKHTAVHDSYLAATIVSDLVPVGHLDKLRVDNAFIV